MKEFLFQMLLETYPKPTSMRSYSTRVEASIDTYFQHHREARKHFAGQSIKEIAQEFNQWRVQYERDNPQRT